ncbi:hypothetical protein GXW82_44020 [Streptacidiphilus sp. 4-A2]|nr:hypothetical protein [Streptacidiphilus sp. 4-A2]
MTLGEMDNDPLTRWQACWDCADLVLEERVRNVPAHGLTTEQEITWTGADRGLVRGAAHRRVPRAPGRPR